MKSYFGGHRPTEPPGFQQIRALMLDQSNASQPSLKKVLTWVDAMGILVGITIGSGIFATPQRIAMLVESFPVVLGLWVGVAAFALIGGLIYAELGTRMPVTGGEYVYITKAFGPFAGFMFGWAQLFIIRTSPAAGLSIIAVDYLEHFVALTSTQQTLAALGIIVVIGCINYLGVKPASVFQNVTSVLKVAGLIAIIVLGVLLVGPAEGQLQTAAPVTLETGMLANLVAALYLVMFTSIGWERVGYVAGEMKNPRRALPRGILLGLAVVGVVYLLANTVYFRTLGIEGLRAAERVATATMTVAIGPVGAAIIAVIVVISCTGSINGTMLSSTRVYYTMAKDGLFFRWFQHVHPKYRTPALAILAHCVWGAVILLARGGFEDIVAGMIFAVLIFYGVTASAFFVLRHRRVGEAMAFKMPGYPILPAVYLAITIALVVLRAWYEPQASLIDLAFVATGLPFAIYWVWGKGRRSRRAAAAAGPAGS